jgi:hypothetical protein
MKKINIGTVVTCSLAMSSCGGSSNDSSAAIEQCVARGIAYFKEIGSYPTLNSAPNAGRSAEEVTRERCNRTISAF